MAYSLINDNPYVSALQLSNNPNDGSNAFEDKALAESAIGYKPAVARAEEILIKHIEWVNGGLRSSEHVGPVLIGDLGEVLRNFHHFQFALPEVDIHYAVKANSEPLLIRLLVNAGSSFDCAGMAEVKLVLEMGGDPAKIIWAHPRCAPEQLSEAWSTGVKYAVFDSSRDLINAQMYYPQMKFLIRITVDDSGSKVPLAKKFGIRAQQVPKLLGEAKARGLDVVGVAFHVGSDSHNPHSFATAIEDARKTFAEGTKHGFRFNVLDLGGGYTQAAFNDMAATIRDSLDKHFPTRHDMRVIAEPGRFLVSSAFVLGARVIGEKPEETEISEAEDSDSGRMIDLNDGVYGNLANTVSDGQERTPIILSKKDPSNNLVKYNMIWGPTCDSFDKLTPSELPGLLQFGDWVYFEDQGAYTIACTTTFNGNAPARIIWTSTQDEVYHLLDLKWKLRLYESNFLFRLDFVVFLLKLCLYWIFNGPLSLLGRRKRAAIALD